MRTFVVVAYGSSGIVNMIKNVHRVLIFVAPSLPPSQKSFENVDFYRPRMKMQKKHLKKYAMAIDPLPPPPAYFVYACENGV